MSKFAKQTEETVIRSVTKVLNIFDGLAGLNMTIEDAARISIAEHAIKDLISANGYDVAYVPGRGTTVKKYK